MKKMILIAVVTAIGMGIGGFIFEFTGDKNWVYAAEIAFHSAWAITLFLLIWRLSSR